MISIPATQSACTRLNCTSKRCLRVVALKASNDACKRRDVLTSTLGGVVTTTVLPPLAPLASASNILTPEEFGSTSAARSSASELATSYYAAPSTSGRDLAMPYAERVQQGLQGLLPPTVTDLQTEMARVMVAVDRAGAPLQKYQALMALSESDPPLFYALLQSKLEQLLPLLYTPTVGEACLNWGTLLARPKGLYISYHRHRGNVQSVVNTWPETQVKVAVVTDGERILGLGDLGAHGMGIPVGKAVVYGAAGVNPSSILPVTVDVGCNTDAITQDPFYCGTRERRIPDSDYFAFMGEVCEAIQARYGRAVLIHWEDVSSRHSFRLLEQLSRTSQPTFNDDIQCTSVITLAALLGATRLPGVPALPAQRVLFFGAGQSNLGGAQLFCEALKAQGLSQEEAEGRIWLMDSKGLITSDREKLSAEKEQFAHARPRSLAPGERNLLAVVRALQPTALIGASAQGGAFTQDVIQAMVAASDAFTAGNVQGRPIVFALSNPTSKSECTFQQAHEWSRGRVVFASGSQFPPITIEAGTQKGRQLVAAQANNCFVFPGLALGCIASQTTQVAPAFLLAAAGAIAGQQHEQNLRSTECVLPPLSGLRTITEAVRDSILKSVPA